MHPSTKLCHANHWQLQYQSFCCSRESCSQAIMADHADGERSRAGNIALLYTASLSAHGKYISAGHSASMCGCCGAPWPPGTYRATKSSGETSFIFIEFVSLSMASPELALHTLCSHHIPSLRTTHASHGLAECTLQACEILGPLSASCSTSLRSAHAGGRALCIRIQWRAC